MLGLQTSCWGIPGSGNSLVSGSGLSCSILPPPRVWTFSAPFLGRRYWLVNTSSGIQYRKWPYKQGGRTLTQEPRSAGSGSHLSNHRHGLQDWTDLFLTLALLFRSCHIFGKSFTSLSPGFLFLRRDYSICLSRFL